MVHIGSYRLAVGLLLALPGVVSAEDQKYEIRWSTSVEAAFHEIASREADDDITGFFDQYQFTPNKGDAGAIEIGVTEATFDLLGDRETPILRFRLASPTSNLGLGQPDVERPFLNQRAVILAAQQGLFLDLRYRRLRTENLRQFPDPTGSALTFTDLTDRDDRFFKERTGFDGTIRFRPQDRFEGLQGTFSALDGELELRGGYEARNGERQTSFILAPTNDWLSVDRDVSQEVGTIGGGFLVSPGGLFTLALDVDHQRFREGASTRTDAGLGAPFPSSTRAIGFIPDTDRTTGALRMRRRFGERAEIRGGFQISLLEQVSGRTPDQRSARLDDNRLLFTSANLATDVQLLPGLSASAFFKYDERDNQLDRDTSLFNAGGGTQVGEFLDNWRRIATGGELVYAFHGRNQVSVGVKAEWVDRDLDFVDVSPAPVILPTNAAVTEETEMVTLYGRTRLNPLRGFDFRAEIGYRDAPNTGYVVDLDDYLFGSVDASYAFPLARPFVVSAFVRGGTGKNRQFDAVGGVGPTPAGARVNRDFERTEIFWGVTATASPWKRVTLFSSFYQSQDAQDYDLVLSDQPRYFQSSFPLTFTADGPIDYRSKGIVVISGANVVFDENTDAGVTYSFSRSKTRYRTSGSGSGAIEMVGALSRIDAEIHRIGLKVGRRLRDGLRVTAGYDFDLYDDRTPVRGTGVTQPFDRGTYQHTVTLGVTLTNALLEPVREDKGAQRD